jgi:uncharacterized membrane protein YgcG
MQKRLLHTATILWIATLCLVALAEVEQPRPMPNTFVHDFAGVISGDKKAEIQAKAQRLKDEYNTEIAVVTIESLEGEDSVDYSTRMARAWGIGSKDNEIRGLLILVATKDRRTEFRTSRHIEGEIPDGVTGEINREMGAFFKKGDFGGGLALGLDKVLERIKEVYEPSSAKAGSGSLGWVWGLIIGFPSAGIGLAIFLSRKRKREKEAETARRLSEKAAAARRKAFPVTAPAKSNAKRKSRSKTKPATRRASNKNQRPSSYKPGSASSYDTGWSSYSSGSSSSSDSGSSSSSDSSSSYSGGSDFGGGGSGDSW